MAVARHGRGKLDRPQNRTGCGTDPDGRRPGASFGRIVALGDRQTCPALSTGCATASGCPHLPAVPHAGHGRTGVAPAIIAGETDGRQGQCLSGPMSGAAGIIFAQTPSRAATGFHRHRGDRVIGDRDAAGLRFGPISGTGIGAVMFGRIGAGAVVPDQTSQTGRIGN